VHSVSDESSTQTSEEDNVVGRTSENPVEGTGQTRTKFWDEVAVAYSQLKKQQEAYDSHQGKKAKYNSVLL